MPETDVTAPKVYEQIRPRGTPACCWDVKQPTSKQPTAVNKGGGGGGWKRGERGGDKSGPEEKEGGGKV